MSKVIVTHPDNLHYVEAIVDKMEHKEVDQLQDFVHFINPFRIEIRTNLYMEKEKWTGKWEVLQSNFYSYWDGQGEPPSWCIYFGFVRKVMEPLFYEVEEPRMTFLNPDWGNLSSYKPSLMLAYGA